MFLFSVIYLLLDFSKINCQHRNFSPIRQYPDQWEETTNYTYQYLNSKYTIKEKGSDLLALSALLLSMGYDMHPAKLNAYIIQKNGTFDNGKNVITYFPGNILNWEGFKQFGLEYIGEFDHPDEFMQIDLSGSYVNQPYGIIAVVDDSFMINGVQFQEYQYVMVIGFWRYAQSLSAVNPNHPHRVTYYYHQIIKYILFKKIQNGTGIMSCSDYNVLEGDKSQCLTTIPNGFYRCGRYIKNIQNQIECLVCKSQNYLNTQNECNPCPSKCYDCELDYNGEVKCKQCAYSAFQVETGCQSKKQGCKQLVQQDNGTLKCISCYDGYVLYYYSSYGQFICNRCKQKQCYNCTNHYSNTCFSCYPPYTVVNGVCQLDTSIDTSDRCANYWGSRCVSCQEPFTLFFEQCVDCVNQFRNQPACYHSHYFRCQQIYYSNCQKCKNGYRLIRYYCMIDPYQKCIEQASGFDPACLLCEKGYYLNLSRVCVPCQDGYTSFSHPYSCLKCSPPKNDYKDECKVVLKNDKCVCTGKVLNFILQISAINERGFFQASNYRRYKLYQSIAFYLGIDHSTMEVLNFEYIKNGDQNFYVIVGYIQMKVSDFEQEMDLEAIEQKLKNSIFDFDEYTMISVYTNIAPLKVQYNQAISSQLTQVQDEEQEGISNNLILFCVIGGSIAYLALIFCCNYYKNTIKECSKEQKPKIESESTLREIKSNKQSSKQEKVTMEDISQKKKYSRRKRLEYIMDIADIDQ